MVRVTLYWKEKVIDLTDHVDWRTIVVSETADETLNTASFEMPSTKGQVQGLDFSRPLPRLALVEIELEGTKQFLVSTDNVEEEDETYKHKVECVSVAKLLLDTTNAGLTITQPSGDMAYYFRSYSFYSGHFDSESKTQVPLTIMENSIDTDELDGLTMKKDKEYTINFKGTFYTNSIILWLNDWYTNKFELIFEINGKVVKKQNVTIQRRDSILDLIATGGPKKRSISFTIKHQNVGTQTLKAYLRMYSDTHNPAGNMEVEDFKVSITTTGEGKDETIFLDYVVEKLLKNDMNEQRFFLDETSKGYLSTIPSHEYTLPESYLWLQIQRIAEHIKAFPTARMGDFVVTDVSILANTTNPNYYEYDHTLNALTIVDAWLAARNLARNEDLNIGEIIRVYTIIAQRYSFFMVKKTAKEKVVLVSITPYEDLLTEAIPEGIDSEHKSATIDDYASRLEINAENIYSEQTIHKEITSLRAEGELTQVTTDNIIIPTKYGIGEIVSFRIKTPRELKLKGGTITIAKGTWVDIDPARILRKEHYDTLNSEGWYNLGGRRNLMKNNTLFYNVGGRNIYGLSYIGGQDKTLIGGGQYIRAIYEIILATLCDLHDDEGIYDNWDNGKVVNDNSIIVEIEYKPHKRTSANIYKSDQSGFEFATSKFLNDAATLNSPDIIASYTQAMADRSGGTIIDYTGVTELGNTVGVLTTWDEMPLFAKTIRRINERQVGYSYQYIKDFVFHSSYEGYNKKERLEQVPRDSVVDRVSKKNTLVVFDKVEKASHETPFSVDLFVEHLGANYTNNSPRMALLTHKRDSNVRSFLPVSTEAYGKTIEFLIEMKDNYSAGLFKYSVGVGDNTQVYQQDHRYTNEFGRVEDVEIRLFTAPLTPPLLDDEVKDLPKVPSRIGGINAFYITEYNERKDARERSVYSLQVSYISANDDIIIYDAISKFSNMVNKSINKDIICGKFGVMPSRMATTIDSIIETKEKDVVIDFTGASYIELMGAGNYVVYDRNSRELLLAVKFETAGVNKLYFRGENQ